MFPVSEANTVITWLSVVLPQEKGEIKRMQVEPPLADLWLPAGSAPPESEGLGTRVPGLSFI